MSSCQQFTSAAGSYISITQLTASIILRNVMLLCVVIMWRALNALKMSCSFSWERKRWHSGGSLGWPFPKLKYKYIFQIKYTEAIYPNSTRKLFWFEISKMLNAVLKSKFIVLFIIIVGTISFPITHVIRPEKCPMTHRLIACSACWCIIAVYCMIELLLTVLESWDC